MIMEGGIGMYDITVLIQALDGRLRYLFTECPAEEYNQNEVNAIINLQKEYVSLNIT